MAGPRATPPVWFWIAAVIFTLWGAMGIFAFYSDVTMSAAAKAALPEYDRALLASCPSWFIWLYGAAVWSGLFGGIALLLRSASARMVTMLSVVLIVIMFGYIFAVTDLIAAKGFGAAAGFPIFVFVMGVAQTWLATMGIKRSWLS